MARETELKYSVSNETWSALLSADRIGEYSLEEAEYGEVHDVYSDTPDRAISSAGFAFRIRSRGEVRVACLKSLGRGDGLGHRRVEYECDIGALESILEWPDGETRDRLLQITGGEPLRTEVEIRQTRVKRLLRLAAEAVAEMSLDEVRFQSGSQMLTFFELEVELLSDALDHVLERIHADLTSSYDLQAVDTSKYERAMAFRDGVVGTAQGRKSSNSLRASPD